MPLGQMEPLAACERAISFLPLFFFVKEKGAAGGIPGKAGGSGRGARCGLLAAGCPHPTPGRNEDHALQFCLSALRSQLQRRVRR